MPQRILIIGEYGSRNGGENSFLAVLPRLMDHGFTFHAIVPPHSEFSESLAAAGCSLSPFSAHDSDGQRKSQDDIRSELARQIKQIGPDLVHCNSLSTSRLTGPVTQALKTPSLGYLRDILKLSRKAVADINQLDQRVAVSQATRDWHCQQGIEQEKTHVIYNGVDSSAFFPSTIPDNQTPVPPICPIREELKIPPDSPVLLFVGQIGIRKGIDTLVNVFLNVARKLPDTHLLIVGKRHSQKQESIDYERQIVEQGESSDVHQNIHWLGNRTDVPELMRTATLLVHPARQEPLGRVLLEAAASGLPMVTTNIGGTPEIINAPDLQRWLLFEPNDVNGMTQAIIDQLLNPTQRHALGIRLRELACEQFSTKRCADQLSSRYHHLLRR